MALTRCRSTYFIGTYYLGRYSYSFHEQRLGVSSFFFCILWSCQSGRQCPCQQNACLKNTVFWIKQEQTGRPKSKVSTYNAQEAWDGCEGGDQVPTYQGQLLHLWSPWWSSCPNITRVPVLSPPLPYVSIKLYVLLYIAKLYWNDDFWFGTIFWISTSRSRRKRSKERSEDWMRLSGAIEAK